jgi:hypothetical protein
VSGIIDGKQVPPSARQSIIVGRLLVSPNTTRFSGMVTVVMILMNGGHLVGGIDYCRSPLTSLPNQPVIPSDAAYHQWWHGRIKPAAKSEISTE